MDFMNKFTEIFETGDVSSRLRPKYNLKQPEDLVRFNKFIYDSVDQYNKQKFIKSKHSKCKKELIGFCRHKGSVDASILEQAF